jgi:hypothetical protein
MNFFFFFFFGFAIYEKRKYLIQKQKTHNHVESILKYHLHRQLHSLKWGYCYHQNTRRIDWNNGLVVERITSFDFVLQQSVHEYL